MQAILRSLIGPRKELHDLSGRVAVVTGGSTGIGFEVSRAFIQCHAAKVIMVSHNWDHGDAGLRNLKSEFGVETPVEWIQCELGNLEEVRKVFSDIRKNEDRLDILVLSAGINSNKFALDHDEIERIFAINWLGHLYAVNQLYPLMRRTAKMSPDTPAPRIVFESSDVHRLAPSNVKFRSLEEINNPKLGPVELYARSKLAVILGVKYGLLQRVIDAHGDRIYALSVHPGTVNTELQQQYREAYPGWLGSVLTYTSLALGRSPEQGACSAIYAASSPEVEKKRWNGVYLTDPGQLGKESSQASDPQLGAALWDLSMKVIKQKLGDDALIDWGSEGK
ncbi:hypothetical protein VTN31DRAFT_6820 [Thermomyces dupontii]|uniref:uncharacterized protein n=1 Tax=Talaromyces thermophilus TaxID=28565 RepID=UPI003743CAA4